MIHSLMYYFKIFLVLTLVSPGAWHTFCFHLYMLIANLEDYKKNWSGRRVYLFALILAQTFSDIINKNVRMILIIVDKNSIVLHNFSCDDYILNKDNLFESWVFSARSIPGI
jgi:hypothetical protein